MDITSFAKAAAAARLDTYGSDVLVGKTPVRGVISDSREITYTEGGIEQTGSKKLVIPSTHAVKINDVVTAGRDTYTVEKIMHAIGGAEQVLELRRLRK